MQAQVLVHLAPRSTAHQAARPGSSHPHLPISRQAADTHNQTTEEQNCLALKLWRRSLLAQRRRPRC
jgi:hypothetical protein